MDDLLDRAHGTLLGLAAGDASGFPAAYHRQLRSPVRRGLLWSQAMELDEQHINKFPLPFSHSAPLADATFSATDDAEQAALGAAVLLAAIAGGPDQDPSAQEFFAAWQQIVLPQQDTYWGSVADRSAILNTLEGLEVPYTGTDNPHFYDDSSVARCVPIGIAYSGDPCRAADIARRLASITNDGPGIEAAAVFAATVAMTTSGQALPKAVAAAMAEIETNSWLGRKCALAESILADAGSPFDAVPRWNDEIANLEYNFGNIAAETAPLALIIARESHSLGAALGLANLIPKQADTMPAMVGALIGSAGGVDAIPRTWRERVETLRGFGVRSTAGVVLRDLAQQLIKIRGDSSE
jgi:ADP-ribosylglycohydrolase